jgi:predicted nucleotidyltransferase
LQTPAKLPAESRYLASARGRLRDSLGQHLVGVYVGGSFAVGDYMPGRSDLDLAAVVRPPLSPALHDTLVARLRHEALPCPARRLELVVYRLETARSASAVPDFELNLNTGAGMLLSVQAKSEPGDIGAHWFPIDRSVLSQAGVALLGPPAGEVFAQIAVAELTPVLIESVRWHRERRGEPSDAVLNACRSLRFAEEVRWSSKPSAGRWAVERGLAPRALVSQALQARTEGRRIDPSQVARFLERVEARLEQMGN